MAEPASQHDTKARPRDAALGSGPGRVLLTVYIIFAVAAGARAGVQIALKFSEAPLAYLLSALAAAVYIAATVVNYGFTPISDFKQWRDESTGWAYGWGPIAAAVEQAKAEHKVGFVAAPDYTTASLLGFYAHDPDVTSLSPARDEFDYWFDPQSHAGEDALLFDDSWRPMGGDITSHFASVTPLVTLPVVVDGKELDVHRLYLATGYKPNG